MKTSLEKNLNLRLKDGKSLKKAGSNLFVSYKSELMCALTAIPLVKGFLEKDYKKRTQAKNALNNLVSPNFDCMEPDINTHFAVDSGSRYDKCVRIG